LAQNAKQNGKNGHVENADNTVNIITLRSGSVSSPIETDHQIMSINVDIGNMLS